MIRSVYAAAATALVASLLASHVSAQPLMQPNISVAMAREALDAAIQHCGMNDGLITVSYAIVDRAGDAVLQLRGDNASPHNYELAFRKAYTARTYRRPSIEWRDTTAGDSDTQGQRQLTDVIPLGGGIPIMVGENAIGAIGVSGAAGGQPMDSACAEAGVAAIADQLQ
jgi:uncharacterized protein GlcG (DUF336 family)